MSKSVEKLAKLAKKVKSKSPRYSLVESKLRNSVMYGYCEYDRAPVMISSDKDGALDYILSLIRKEKSGVKQIASEPVADIEEISEDDSLIAEVEEL